MIEATCAACGTVNRIADADVPVGAKFVNCASCKSRVAIPAMVAAAPPPSPALDLADLPAPRRSSPLGADVAKPAPRSGLSAASTEADAELPAPRTKKPSPSAAMPSPAGPLDLDDLLAPSDAGVDLPAPRPKDRGALDLPAPKPRLGAALPDLAPPGAADAAPLADLPAPKAKLSDVADLPAPRPRAPLPPLPAAPRIPSPAQAQPPGPPPITDLPGPKASMAKPAGLDLPGPKAPTPPAGVKPPGLVDLPGPKAATTPMTAKPPGLVDLPGPKSPAGPGAAARAPGLVDLPGPKSPAGPGAAAGAPGLVDLPGPKAPAGPGTAARSPDFVDLPGPKAPTGPGTAARAPGVVDLPGPKSPTGPAPVAAKPPGLADLPGPKLPAAPGAVKPTGIVDLPSPKPGGIVDLPMPKSGLSDLPAPKPGQAGDLPAPKGFFDDLPQPARSGAQPPATDIAPKGFFDDLPQPARAGGAPTADEVAPKGFFDDLPGRPSQPKPEPPAPKGFFDDLPGKPSQSKPEAPAPKGFFDDLPGKPSQPKPEPPAPKGFFDDLPKPSAAKSRDIQLDSLELESEAPSGSGIELDLDGAGLELAPEEPAQPRPKAPSIAPAPGPSNQFDDLDLSAPSPVSFAKGRPAGPGSPAAQVATLGASNAAATSRSSFPALNAKSDVALELEEPREPMPSSAAKLGPKQREEQRQAKAAESREKAARRRKLAGIALAAAVVLGGGGFFAYRHFAQKAAHEAAINDQLGAARAAIAQNQWAKAAGAASKTLELDTKNAEAFGIRAEALFALGIVEGNNAGRFGQARKSLADALAAGVTHPAVARAQGLSPLAANQPDQAVPRLTALAAKAPKDGGLQLYLGWANAELGDFDAAIKSFDAAVASPTVKVHALLGRARAKQAKGDFEGARTDYADVLAIQKDHIGAQVGLASALPAQQAQQQEADLLAILAIKDVEKREPRAAMQAWRLAAELAFKGGRLDVARERYRKLLAMQPAHVGALLGMAQVELRDAKLDVATEMIDKALKAAPQDLRASLVATEIAIAKKQYDDAAKRLDAATKRTPPPPVLDQSRIKGLEGRLHEAQGKEQDAIEAYLASAKLAGEQDLAPTLFAAARIMAFADKAAAANDAARASELRKQADELLSALADAALKDPTLALTLGMAYLVANDPVKAESWLRKAIELQPKNIDAMYQLAKALAKQGKDAEAIGNLRSAVELDPTRSEIGLELARRYEETKRDADAAQLYEKLLAAKEPPIELRARAGRFFARMGQMDKAGEQGQEILKVQEDHPAGLYLKGEGLLKTGGKTDQARKLLVQASDADPEPQYMDARGRAAEAWATESGNTQYQDDAIRAYGRALEKDPTIFTSWLGLGRLYVLRKEDGKALVPLQKAWALKQTGEVARLLGIAVKNVNAQPKEAAAWLEKSFELEPNAETAFNLGQLYTDARLNDPRRAIAAFDRAAALALASEKQTGTAPAWLGEALYQLGNLNNAQNNLKAAKAAWEKWLQRNPKQDARYKEVKGLMATSLKDQ